MGIEWRLFEGSDGEWDALVDGWEGTTHFHGSAWAEAFSAMGWSTRRWCREENGRPVALLQGFLKRYPFGVGVLWLPDWIVGDYRHGGGLAEYLRDSLGVRHLYVRFRSHHRFDDMEYIQVLQQGWRRPARAFNDGLTMTLDLRLDEGELESRPSSNWRKNLKRSARADYEIRPIRDPEVVVRLYKELSRMKELDELLTPAEIRGLMRVFGDDLIVLGAIDPQGEVLAVRGAIIHGDGGWDIFAATGAASRKIYVSYALFIALIKACKARGCEHYDLNGIDPVNNVGVYNFKKGSGAAVKRQLGEFEWATSPLLARLINLRAKRR